MTDKYDFCQICSSKKKKTSSLRCRSCFFDGYRKISIYNKCVDCDEEKSGDRRKYERCRTCSYAYKRKNNKKLFDCCVKCGNSKKRTYAKECKRCSQKGIKASKQTRDLWSKQRAGAIPWNKGKKMEYSINTPVSWDTRTKISNSKTGLNRTVDEYKEYCFNELIEGRKKGRNNYYKHKRWSYLVKKRDNFLCIECGNGENLQAHHIKSWNEYPSFRFEVDNGVCLCEDCHKQIHAQILEEKKK